ncbi:complement C1q-like protein 3 [Littorina saxatilis]|uniref:C1q domain-containing protein n=1 Tax=Littorina saxatilis TaxID=31220 RepID=A0AAN9AW82_9CAEN
MSAKIRAVCLLYCFVISLVSEGGVVKRSDDVDVQDLENLVLNQASTMAQIEAWIAALKNQLDTAVEGLSSLTAKVGTISTAVAFTVRFNADDDWQAGIPLTHRQVLQFDKVVTNVGNGYNPSTGKFTAPVRGVYAFLLNLFAPSNSNVGQLGLLIVKQDVVIVGAWGRQIDDEGEPASTQVSIELAAGEQVWVRQDAGRGVRGGVWTVFTGYLLQAL